ncbi:hypothetical protein DVH24_040699 [Malus domestica]|uniref:Uncharacterized protein n=1 Tax=Malus domestica TaxID=3750 RepID=A0A498IBM4_MALDO|nr:hypothetical protein DVH24_040699 [Malus domestica]
MELQCSFNERTHYQTTFFSKSFFTKKFTKRSADLFHSRLFSQHSRLFSQQLFFKAQQYQTSPKSLTVIPTVSSTNLRYIIIKQPNHWSISELLSSLDKNWPSLKCPSNDGYGFWSHEWEKHGTCSESELDQKEYFEAALKLKKNIESIVEAMKEGAGYTPGIECNNYSAGNSQLYQVYLCVHTSGKTSLSVLSFQRKDVLLKFIISH